MIKFNVASKPELSQEEYNATAESQRGGKFLPPGTFDLTIVGVTVAENSDRDDENWISLTFELQDSEGRGCRHFLSVPTVCRNSFLYGQKKSAYQYEKVAAFFRGLGLVLDYDNAMTQIAAVFGNYEKNLIGKTIKVRMGHKGPYLKYLGKTEGYQVVDKEGKPKLDGVFPDSQAAKRAAEDNNLKLTFCNILEIFQAKTPALQLVGNATPVAADDLPF